LLNSVRKTAKAVSTQLARAQAAVAPAVSAGSLPFVHASSTHNADALNRVSVAGYASKSARRQQAITAGATLQVSVQQALPLLCERQNLAVAEVFIPSEKGSEFVFADFYARRDVDVESPTVGSPVSDATLAAAFESKKASVTSVESEALKKAGLKSAVVVPLVVKGEVKAVLRFVSAEPVDAAEVESFAALASNMVEAGVNGNTQPPKFRPVTDIPEGQMEEVFKLIVDEGVFSPSLVYNEVDWFYNMGLQIIYFKRFPARILANHIHSYIAAKKFAATTGNPENIWLHIENNPKLLSGSGPEQSLYMVPYQHNIVVAVERGLERRIAAIPEDKPYSMEFFLSSRPHIPGGKTKMAIYVLQTNTYVNPAKIGSTESNIKEVASDVFLKEKTQAIVDRYQDIVSDAVNRLSPVARQFETYRDGTTPLMFAFNHSAGTTTSYMLQLTELLKQGGLVPTRKFIETFANGIRVFSLYLKPTEQAKIDTLLKQFSMLHLVPKSSLTPMFLSGEYSAEAYTYSSAASRFIYYFIHQQTEEFKALVEHLKNDPVNLGRLRLLHTSLKREAVSTGRIAESLMNHGDIVELLFKDFAARVSNKWTSPPAVPEEILKKISNEATSPLDEQILRALVTFNTHVLKTNFYKTKKSALSFRMDTKFLAGSDWPKVPFGIFFVMGSDFQGFHIRFEDVSRGGIRVIRSRDHASYNKNLSTIFAENFNLAYTQNKKNKDIPEFGSKGTVLLHRESQNNSLLSFQKYTSGLLDLVVGNKEVVDNYGREELLFLGPDEGSAGYMEWAARYAERKGYKFWRSFTTGKPPSLGGIPHDTYGMTTRSVHRYVTGCLEKMGLDETKVTKIQTGGPDGDLGSNEILISKDMTKAIIDGAGVIYDPAGLNREELVRLAKQRSMISGFDTSKLGPGGFRVLVDDVNVTLPNGEVVPNGATFRNNFHLHPLATADLFVPCGGRPESVNLSNVHNLLNKDGTPKFKIIVEGANLFFTQDARMQLEKAGVVLYKDASSNKGGVTSSSLEVLAALALDDAEFSANMAVTDKANPPKFYQEYVAEIQKRIEADAYHEFDCIWREHERTKMHRYLLTDIVSDKINELNSFINNSALFDNKALRLAVLSQSYPKKLQELKSIEKILERVPESYSKATFSAYLSSRYIYKYGINANEFAFYEYMQSILTSDLYKSFAAKLGQQN